MREQPFAQQVVQKRLKLPRRSRPSKPPTRLPIFAHVNFVRHKLGALWWTSMYVRIHAHQPLFMKFPYYITLIMTSVPKAIANQESLLPRVFQRKLIALKCSTKIPGQSTVLERLLNKNTLDAMHKTVGPGARKLEHELKAARLLMPAANLKCWLPSCPD